MPINTIVYYSRFRKVIHVFGVGYQCVTLPFAMPSKLDIRLACLRHAASVHPEPGSNSLVKRELYSSRYESPFIINGKKFLLSELVPVRTKIRNKRS